MAAFPEENLAVLGLSTKTGGNIAQRADCGIAGAFGKPDLAQGRVTLGDTGAKSQIAATFAPGGDQLVRRLAHRHRHLDRALGRVGTWQGIVEEHHDAVARELVKRALELADQRPQGAVVFAQEFENFLGLGSLGEGSSRRPAGRCAAAARYARIRSIDTATAKAAPGVLVVLTGADWKAAGWRELPSAAGNRRRDGSAAHRPRYPALVENRVRWLDDYVAFS